MKPGDAIGAYRLEAPLGHSQIGQAWRAVHTQLESRVRLLVVVVPPALRATLEETFARRVLPLSNFQATQLDRLVDSGMTADGLPYFVTELLEGERLDQRLARTGPLPADEAVALGVEVFAGLEVMHDARVVHGRVAPARAFLLQSRSIDGPVTWLRLLEVGLSYVLKLPAQVEAEPACLAPELRAGQAPTVAGDVYAAAQLVRLMLGGAAPPQAVADLLEVCTDIDPERRPTAADARTRLAEARDGGSGGGAEIAGLVVQATPASGEEAWLGGWDDPAAGAASPANVAKSSKATKAAKSGRAAKAAAPAPGKGAPRATPAAATPPPAHNPGRLGGWDEPATPAPKAHGPAATSSPALLYGLAALAAAAIVAFIVRAVMIAPGEPPVFDSDGATANAVDAAIAVDARIYGDGEIDPAKAVKIFVSPAGARFVQVGTGRVLCEAAPDCLVPIDQDTRLELADHEPRVLTGDDLYDRRGGKWIVRMHPVQPKEESEPREHERRRRRRPR